MSSHMSNFFGVAKLTLGMDAIEFSSCVSGIIGYGVQRGGREGENWEAL